MSARTPQDTDRLFGEHVNARDLDALVALYEPEAVLVNQDGTLAIGRDAIRAALSGLLEMRPRIRMHVAKTVSAGADLAMLYNEWSMSIPGPDGQTVEMSGKALEVVRRQADGTWRFVIDDPFARG